MWGQGGAVIVAANQGRKRKRKDDCVMKLVDRGRWGGGW